CMEQSDWWPAPVGAHSVRNALALVACKGKSLRLPSAAELLSLCVAKEKDNQRERPPRLALAGHPARQVREPGPGFSTGHPALAKRSRHPCRLPLRGLSSPTHRRTGVPGRAAGHRGPHSSKEPKLSTATTMFRDPVCQPSQVSYPLRTGDSPYDNQKARVLRGSCALPANSWLDSNESCPLPAALHFR